MVSNLSENKCTPEIRFAGFTDPWEQRRLENVITIFSGKDYKHLSSGMVPVFGTGGCIGYVSDALSFKDDALGIGRKGTIDKPFVLKAPFWTVDTLYYSFPILNNRLKFLASMFENIDWSYYDESTGVPSLSKETIYSIEVNIPKVSEQTSIESLFDSIDTLITLHQ